jgi:hypothetical protein
MINHNMTTKYTEAYPAFYKYIFWFFENETRWQVLVDKNELQDTNKYDYHLIATIPQNIMKSIKIRLAPEVEDCKAIEEIQKLLKEVDNLNEVEKSTYTGFISMGL